MSRNRNVASAVSSPPTVSMTGMHTHLQLDIPAPWSHVQYVLGAVDEYPSWNSAVRGGADDLRWELVVSPSRRRELPAAVWSVGDMTTISLYRGPFAVVRFDLVPVEATPSRTTLLITAWCSPRFVVVPKHAIVMRLARTLGNDIAQRARWLPAAPDSGFRPVAELQLVPSPTRTASLEQLLALSRELEGGILAVESATSCCLLDLERECFVRAEPSADVRQLVHFGRWQGFDDVICENDDLVIVPSGGAARVRMRVRTRSAV
jgi:hypothetical protein